MKVTRMTVTPLSVPMDYPFQSPAGGLNAINNPVIVQLYTDDGADAFGICTSSNNTRVKSLKACLEDLAPIVIGQDVARINEAWQKLWVATGTMGHTGYGIMALSAIDNALWVLRSKMLNLPLSTLLGGFRDKVPAYCSYLLWRNWTLDQLQKDAEAIVKMGFKAAKMRFGTNPFDVEAQRYRAVREVVGKNFDIMVDCNWAYTVPQAIEMGRKVDGELYWFEDPLASDDPDQIAQVSAALDMPVTVGETWSTKFAFRAAFEKRASDMVMIDVQKVGGVTEWIRVANMASAFNIPVASHLFDDISCHLVGAIPNGVYCEYMPWYDKIYRNPPQVKDGFIEIPKVPGIGWEIDPASFKKFEFKG
jgi:L-alanine-DL-glutamate epimerase-like enolase superfamily enzyme